MEKIGKYLFLLFCISIIVGGYFYLHTTLLNGLRIFTLCSIAYFLVLPPKRLSRTFYYTLLFYLCYVVYTLLLSLFQSYEITLSQTLNFLFIPLFLLAVMAPACQRPAQYLHYFYHFCMGAVVVLTILGFAEYFTQWHLYGSALLLAEFADITSASTFFHNPNDFAVVVTLALLYTLSYRRSFLKERKGAVDLLLAVAVALLVWTIGCRTALCIIILYGIFYFRTFFLRHRILFGTLMLLGVVAVCGYIIFYKDISMHVRSNLYLSLFDVLIDTYGLGGGLLGDTQFLVQSRNWSRFSHITNAHSYLLHFIYTSGLLFFFAYLWLITHFERVMARRGRNEMWALPILYLLLLFAPSTSICFWPHYLFLGMFVCYAEYIQQSENQCLCR